MKIWLVTRPTEDPLWDVADGFVVRAETEREARALAADNHGDEGREIWFGRATCEELTTDGPRGVILRDFTAGCS